MSVRTNSIVTVICKVNLSLLMPCRHIGGARVYLPSFLISVLQWIFMPSLLYPKYRNRDTHCIGSWVDCIHSGHFREQSQANVRESKPYDPVQSLVYCKKISCSTVLRLAPEHKYQKVLVLCLCNDIIRSQGHVQPSLVSWSSYSL